jgi:hypothetical protein
LEVALAFKAGRSFEALRDVDIVVLFVAKRVINLENDSLQQERGLITCKVLALPL